jgi:hypothetical protein
MIAASAQKPAGSGRFRARMMIMRRRRTVHIRR